MPKLHHVTIPQSAFAALQNFLAEPDSPSSPMFRLTLATLIAPMIGHIRLFQATNDELSNVLEWLADAENKSDDFSRGARELGRGVRAGPGTRLRYSRLLEALVTLSYCWTFLSTPQTRCCP